MEFIINSMISMILRNNLSSLYRFYHLAAKYNKKAQARDISSAVFIDIMKDFKKEVILLEEALGLMAQDATEKAIQNYEKFKDEVYNLRSNCTENIQLPKLDGFLDSIHQEF